MAITAQLAKVPEDTALKSPVPLIVSQARFDSGELTASRTSPPARTARKKKVGIPGPGGFGEYSVALALETAGLTMADIEPVYLGPPDTLAALENGGIDAGWTIEPFPTLWAAETESISNDHARGRGARLRRLQPRLAGGQSRRRHPVHGGLPEGLAASWRRAASPTPRSRTSSPSTPSCPIETLDAIGKTIRSEDGSFDEASVRAQEA